MSNIESILQKIKTGKIKTPFSFDIAKKLFSHRIPVKRQRWADDTFFDGQDQVIDVDGNYVFLIYYITNDDKNANDWMLSDRRVV